MGISVSGPLAGVPPFPGLRLPFAVPVSVPVIMMMVMVPGPPGVLPSLPVTLIVVQLVVTAVTAVMVPMVVMVMMMMVVVLVVTRCLVPRCRPRTWPHCRLRLLGRLLAGLYVGRVPALRRLQVQRLLPGQAPGRLAAAPVVVVVVVLRPCGGGALVRVLCPPGKFRRLGPVAAGLGLRVACVLLPRHLWVPSGFVGLLHAPRALR